MAIGIHDRNCPSGLTPMLLWAREMGKEPIPIDDLPTLGSYGISVLIINPTANPDWSEYVDVVKAYPNIRFVFYMPSVYARESFYKNGLNDYDNVEIMDNEALIKLFEL